jgi:hypothetical protein
VGRGSWIKVLEHLDATRNDDNAKADGQQQGEGRTDQPECENDGRNTSQDESND